jgi:hypothetical protein
MVPALTLSKQAFWLCFVQVQPAGVLKPKQTESPLNRAGGGRCWPCPLLPLAAPLPLGPPLPLAPAKGFPFVPVLFPLGPAAAFGWSVFFFSLSIIFSHLETENTWLITSFLVSFQ